MNKRYLHAIVLGFLGVTGVDTGSGASILMEPTASELEAIHFNRKDFRSAEETYLVSLRLRGFDEGSSVESVLQNQTPDLVLASSESKGTFVRAISVGLPLLYVTARPTDMGWLILDQKHKRITRFSWNNEKPSPCLDDSCSDRKNFLVPQALLLKLFTFRSDIEPIRITFERIEFSLNRSQVRFVLRANQGDRNGLSYEIVFQKIPQDRKSARKIKNESGLFTSLLEGEPSSDGKLVLHSARLGRPISIRAILPSALSRRIFENVMNAYNQNLSLKAKVGLDPLFQISKEGDPYDFEIRLDQGIPLVPQKMELNKTYHPASLETIQAHAIIFKKAHKDETRLRNTFHVALGKYLGLSRGLVADDEINQGLLSVLYDSVPRWGDISETISGFSFSNYAWSNESEYQPPSVAPTVVAKPDSVAKTPGKAKKTKGKSNKPKVVAPPKSPVAASTPPKVAAVKPVPAAPQTNVVPRTPAIVPAPVPATRDVATLLATLQRPARDDTSSNYIRLKKRELEDELKRKTLPSTAIQPNPAPAVTTQPDPFVGRFSTPLRETTVQFEVEKNSDGKYFAHFEPHRTIKDISFVESTVKVERTSDAIRVTVEDTGKKFYTFEMAPKVEGSSHSGHHLLGYVYVENGSAISSRGTYFSIESKAK